VVGFTTGSRGEVPGTKENPWQKIITKTITIIIALPTIFQTFVIKHASKGISLTTY
jgi:hypothetical protein